MQEKNRRKGVGGYRGTRIRGKTGGRSKRRKRGDTRKRGKTGYKKKIQKWEDRGVGLFF